MPATTLKIKSQHKKTTRPPVRLLLFTNSVAIGGMEEHVKLLARHLDRTQFTVHVICPRWKQTEAFSQALAGIADKVCEITPDRRYGTWAQWKEMGRLFLQIRAWRIQVMHMHSTTYRGQVIAFLLARLARVRAVYVTEHLAPDAEVLRGERWVRNLFGRCITGIVCVSQKNFVARSSYLYTPTNTVTVKNGIDPNDFPPIPVQTLAQLRRELALPANAQIVGTVVRLEPEKGLDYLLDAMPAIRKACPQSYLVIVGDGSLRQDLEAQAACLGLTEYVRFAGFQSDPRPYLGLMDTFVLPVPVGSMSIGLLEAMAMKRAVVITFGGEGEAVVHEESGLCAEPRNPVEIANSVIRILQNPALQSAYGEAARVRVETHFSAQQVAVQLGELYLQYAQCKTKNTERNKASFHV